MEVLYFLISGTHKTLPIEELIALNEVYRCPLEILSIHTNVVLAKGIPECSEKITERAAFVKEVGKVCAIASENVISWFEECKVGKLKYKSIAGAKSFQLKLEGDGEVAKAIFVEGFAIIGKPLSTRKRGKDEKGPFFSPGSMDPLLARAMVNISRAREGSIFLDPFCGTGTFAIEASRMGIRAYCSDLDPTMVYGSKINSEHLRTSVECLWTDATSLPFRSHSIDSIASDPPYGRSVVAWGPNPKDLLEAFLEEARRVLKSGSWIVLAASEEMRLRESLEVMGFRVGSCHVMRVHRSLSRTICSAIRP